MTSGFFENRRRLREVYANLENIIGKNGLTYQLFEECVKTKKYGNDNIPFKALRTYMDRHRLYDQYDAYAKQWVIKQVKRIQKEDMELAPYDK